MKAEHIKIAEQEAREAVKDLGWNEADIQVFVDWHIEQEAKRELEKERELAQPRRNAELDKAIVHIAVDSFRNMSNELFPAYGTKISAYISDEELMAGNYERKRNRFET